MAIDGQELKAGVIGCGGRGSGAAINFLNAANGVTIVALGDVFQDRVEGLAKKLKDEKNIEIAADKDAQNESIVQEVEKIHAEK